MQKFISKMNPLLMALVNDANPTKCYNSKARIAGKTGDNGRKDVEIIVPLKYLSNFGRTFEMSLINCKVNLITTWSANGFYW